MAYAVIPFDALTTDYNGQEVHIRTAAKDIAVIKILDVGKGIDTVNIKYEFVSGDEAKFKPQGATAVLARGKKMWANPAKFWLLYTVVASSSRNIPENNDGRDTCRACGSPTRPCGGWNCMTDYRICTKCGL